MLMKRTKSSVTALILITAVLLTSCQSRSSVGKCITPPVTWEFPVRATMTTKAMDDLNKEIPPSGSWIIESYLPQTGYIHSLVTRSSNEIWIIIDDDLFMYSTSSHQWQKVLPPGHITDSPISLYIANDGTLWGIDLSRFNKLKNENELPLLMRYDETTGHFEFVKDADGLLNSRMDLVAITEPAKNQNGELWMLLTEDTGQEYLNLLISFDPLDQKIIRHLTIKTKLVITEPAESCFSDMAITPDGRVWIADYGKGQLLYYDPTSGKSNIYKGRTNLWDDISNENLRNYYHLYVDRMGRLWVDDKGFLDFSNPKVIMWHKIVRSPVFIIDAISSEEQYGWIRPNQMYQSSDGLYWFSGYGLVNLDPATGMWCKFTTGSSPIAEDNQGNLWIAVFGKLYKYKLTQ